jgi:hypothetical protein
MWVDSIDERKLDRLAAAMAEAEALANASAFHVLQVSKTRWAVVRRVSVVEAGPALCWSLAPVPGLEQLTQSVAREAALWLNTRATTPDHYAP